jgi:hypothetical protein
MDTRTDILIGATINVGQSQIARTPCNGISCGDDDFVSFGNVKESSAAGVANTIALDAPVSSGTQTLRTFPSVFQLTRKIMRQNAIPDTCLACHLSQISCCFNFTTHLEKNTYDACSKQ